MNLRKPNFNSKSLVQNQSESVKSGKQIAWKQAREETDKITDQLGLNIDEKIKEAVTAFRIHEFTTSQSCEGHIGKKEKHGVTWPWVEIYTPEPKSWRESKGKKKKQLEQKWTIENLKQQQKMMDYLAEFYQRRKTPFDARLVFNRIGAFGGFRVQSFGAEMMKLLSHKEQVQKINLYQKEMNDFADFLKNKYFQKK